MSMKQLLFSFEGRIGRMPFWLATLAMFIVAIVLNVAIFGAAILSGDTSALGGSPGALGGVVSIGALVVALGMLWIGLAVQAKRWHDLDKSAWWILINLVPIVGGLVTLVMCGFLAGTPAQNRFGQPTAA
jgi:uncharacterized membrane protein YhaH (DUF805 family)